MKAHRSAISATARGACIIREFPERQRIRVTHKFKEGE
ncbi:hypothetical protein ASZ90_006572 [hydrocarbon metagenome]|uniref:Uncharacterized protein n=1 Tax=hydrocarbon metagenome TaxID=938273 RepID=A0A0W8FS64_9ZZZZ